ncbi:MAG: hypothetical protein CL908_12420 [Deltaproteobacteria bacterium]|nr:hypothetical protein [Deltaproteobacteria bacterium]
MMTITVHLALLGWIPITVALFVLFRPHIAASLSLIGGIALLPAGRAYDVPLLPALNQSTIPALASLVMLLALRWPMVMGARLGRGPELCVLLLIGASFITNVTNMDPVVFGANVRSAMAPLDTINDAFLWGVLWGVPFVLGRVVVRSAADARDVLVVLMLFGLLYLPLVLVELRTGPWLHKIVYGDLPFAFTFAQQMKFGGFRPLVLMTHGLATAAFMLYCAIAAVTLLRARHRIREFGLAPAAIALVLILGPVKSVGVWTFGAVVLPAICLLRPKLQLAMTVAIAVLVLSYPMIRVAGLVPVDDMVSLAEEYVGARSANSLFGRLKTEEEIMVRAQERLWFGWGGYGRYQIYDEFTGEMLSTLDGVWVITIGEGGAVRFILLFGMLILPIVIAYRNIDRIRSRQARQLIAGLAVIVAIRSLDLLPNSGIEAYLTFMGGALVGAVRGEVSNRRSPPRSEGPKRRADISESPRDEPPASLNSLLQPR